MGLTKKWLQFKVLFTYDRYWEVEAFYNQIDKLIFACCIQLDNSLEFRVVMRSREGAKDFSNCRLNSEEIVGFAVAVVLRTICGRFYPVAATIMS